MSYAAQVLRHTVRRLLTVQVLLIAATALAFLVLRGQFAAVSALYGGGIALVNTLLSAWRLLRATEAVSANPGRGMVEFYIGAAMRFVSVLILTGIGIKALKLEPVAIIAGFAVAQIGYLFNRVSTDIQREE